jgi:hypothetical protein
VEPVADEQARRALGSAYGVGAGDRLRRTLAVPAAALKSSSLALARSSSSRVSIRVTSTLFRVRATRSRTHSRVATSPLTADGSRAAAVAVAAIGGATTIAAASHGGDDRERPITGDALNKASAVALAHTGSGAVTGSEVGDEDGYYEVEVTLADGRQVDVHLDRDFNLLNTRADQERPDDGSP